MRSTNRQRYKAGGIAQHTAKLRQGPRHAEDRVPIKRSSESPRPELLSATGCLSGIDVTCVVEKLADQAGLDASKYAGHSLRAGHRGGKSGRFFGEVHHEPDWAQIRPDGAALHWRRDPVPGE